MLLFCLALRFFLLIQLNCILFLLWLYFCKFYCIFIFKNNFTLEMLYFLYFCLNLPFCLYLKCKFLFSYLFSLWSGVFSLVMYYRWLHPSGPNYLFDIKSSLPGTQQSIVQPNQVNVIHKSYSSCTFPENFPSYFQ